MSATLTAFQTLLFNPNRPDECRGRTQAYEIVVRRYSDSKIVEEQVVWRNSLVDALDYARPRIEGGLLVSIEKCRFV